MDDHYPMHEFLIGTENGGLTWDIFEDMGEDGTRKVCTALSQDYAMFIAHALTVCRAFSPGLQGWRHGPEDEQECDFCGGEEEEPFSPEDN